MVLRRLTLLLAAAAALAAVPVSAQSRSGGADNVVVALNTTDSFSLSRSGLQVAPVGGDTVDSENLALATSRGCTGCRTVAVAMQAVLVTGSPSTVTPRNAAVATNTNCTSCATFAYAYQYSVSTGGPVRLSREGTERVKTLRRQIASVAASTLSFDAMTLRLDELSLQFKAVIDEELVKAGKQTSGTATKRIDTAPA